MKNFKKSVTKRPFTDNVWSKVFSAMIVAYRKTGTGHVEEEREAH